MTTRPTANQIEVLLAFPGYDDPEVTASDLGSSWTDVTALAAATGKSVASVKGTIGSLEKIGFVHCDSDMGPVPAVCLTEEACDFLIGHTQTTDDKGSIGREEATPPTITTAEIARKVGVDPRVARARIRAAITRGDILFNATKHVWDAAHQQDTVAAIIEGKKARS